MKEKEFLVIASAIKAAYPNSNLMVSKDAMNLWYEMLKDLEFHKTQIAITDYISNNKFAPTIADIRAKYTNLSTIPIKDYGEAWEDVLHSIRKYGYMEETKALNSLDEITRKCVKRIGFQNICMSENIVADRANFRMIYEQEASNVKADNQLPLALRVEKKMFIEQMVNETINKLEIHAESIEQKIDHKIADMGKVEKLLRDIKCE